MRIGITLLSLDPTWGGIGTYTEAIIRHLLMVDKENEYVLMYPSFGAPHKMFGQYRKYKNATEVETESSRLPSPSYWDQVVVPKVAKKNGIDVLFSPRMSVPIQGRFKKVMIVHGIERHMVPDILTWKLYVKWSFMERMILPAADRVISISNVMTQDFRRTMKYPIEKVRTVYHGVSKEFRVIHDADRLLRVKGEYELPDAFILFVGHLYPNKNFGNLVRALHLLANKIPHDLVVVGRPRWKYGGDLALLDSLGLRDRVHFLYFIPQEDLVALYNLASCFVFPSFYESFGLVLLEAMACGCPVAGARTGAIPEISAGAAALFDPYNYEEIADTMLRLVSDHEGLRQSCIEKGLARAKVFNWERCATETLKVLEEAAA